jgi:hypothetical protein
MTGMHPDKMAWVVRGVHGAHLGNTGVKCGEGNGTHNRLGVREWEWELEGMDTEGIEWGERAWGRMIRRRRGVGMGDQGKEKEGRRKYKEEGKRRGINIENGREGTETAAFEALTLVHPNRTSSAAPVSMVLLLGVIYPLAQQISVLLSCAHSLCRRTS